MLERRWGSPEVFAWPINVALRWQLHRYSVSKIGVSCKSAETPRVRETFSSLTNVFKNICL